MEALIILTQQPRHRPLLFRMVSLLDKSQTTKTGKLIKHSQTCLHNQAVVHTNSTPSSRTTVRATFPRHTLVSLAVFSPITTNRGRLTSRKARTIVQTSPHRVPASRLSQERQLPPITRTASTSLKSATVYNFSRIRISTRLKLARVVTCP